MSQSTLKKVQGDHHRKRRSLDNRPLAVKKIAVKRMSDANDGRGEANEHPLRMSDQATEPSRGPTRCAAQDSRGLHVMPCDSRNMRCTKHPARSCFETDISRFRLPTVVGRFDRERLNPAAYPRFVTQVFLAELTL